MTTNDIVQILQETSLHLKVSIDQNEIQNLGFSQRSYETEDFAEFKRDLIEAGRRMNLMIIEQNIPLNNIESSILGFTDALIVFNSFEKGIFPDVVVDDRRKVRSLLSGRYIELSETRTWLQSDNGDVAALIVMPYQEIVSEKGSETVSTLSPARRLINLFATEKRDIGYVLIYALIIGLLSLALPLGLQTTIEFISGGVIFSSVYILIGLIILGVFGTGVLQIVQISIVEQIQRRVFVKAALEFAYRIPRIRLESLATSYAPELVNRFFDVITIQKGLPKLLLDLSSGVIQIFFGLLLLSLYHPFFVFFSLFLVGVITLMFYFTGPRGLSSSINESKYKYKVVHWLEEIARTIKSFKLAGNTDLPIRKTDQLAGNYIKFRKNHFEVLLTQFSFFVLFKVAITGGLLIMGTILVVDRQITLGQFVASEVIIILVLNAFEKIVLYTDIVYDLLTAVDKVSHVTDLPIEKSGGFDFPRQQEGKGYSISLHDLSYKYPDKQTPVLNGINLEIQSGERVCISGPGGSGKTTLTNIIGGLYADYTGGVSINKYSLRDLDLMHLRSKVAKNISQDDIFDGTIYENITIGKPSARSEEIIDVAQKVGLDQYIYTLPNGLNTHLISGGVGLSSSAVHRLILARCLAKAPELVILNDFFSGLGKAEKIDLVGRIINPDNKWTLLAVSNDPLIMASCDRVVVLDQGRIIANDNFNRLMKEGTISKYFE
jgi:ABC-type bacteriocin/lantibiotic exporter with double-glycine peptidase domain